MLEFRVLEIAEHEVSGMTDFLKKQGIKGKVIPVAYVACNNGIRHGPSMGYAMERMEQELKSRYGTGVQFTGMIMGSFDNIPQVIANRRMRAMGPFANEPFDRVAYRSVPGRS